MELADVQKHWDLLGSTDPLWAILTEPAKRYGGWDASDFFASGVRVIDDLMGEVDRLALPIPRRRALDFGCGVGRLTQALCRHFERADGVDIAPSMIEQARQFNRFGDRCHFHLNSTDSLGLFASDSFDFINSLIVLQHIEPRYMESYLREFVRILAPGGLIHVQIPVEFVSLALEPLPEPAFRAGLTILEAPRALEPGAEGVVQVRVENLSPVEWPAHGSARVEHPIHLGNHWLDRAGSMVRVDDGRSPLPEPLAPRRRVELPLAVRAPETPGDYSLEIDLVQEGVAWFTARGSRATRTSISVRRPRGSSIGRLWRWSRGVASSRAQGAAALEPIMEMYTLPVRRVVEVVEAAGATVRDVRQWPGGDYRHATYFLTK